MPISHTLGFPPLGAARELKRATEGYWSGKVPQPDLLRTGADLRARHWRLQRDAGIDLPPSNDFSFYDRMLDTCGLVGAVPARYGWSGPAVDLDTYFAMARGVQKEGRDVTAMEMTKWFDTNYHYIVPEFTGDQAFRLASTKPVDEFSEALALGIRTTPVLIGPLTFLLLGKEKSTGFHRLELLDRLLPVYAEVLRRLAAAGADWVQIDEPCLALDRTAAELERYRTAYGLLSEHRAAPRSCWPPTSADWTTISAPPSRCRPGLHLDLVRAPGQLGPLLERWPKGRVLARASWTGGTSGAPISRPRCRCSSRRCSAWGPTTSGSPRPARCCTADRPGARNGARRRARGVAGVRQAEARGGRTLLPGPARRPRSGGPGAGPEPRRLQPRRRASPRTLNAVVRQRAASVQRRGSATLRALRGTPPPAARAAALPHHDDRLVPADARGARGARRFLNGELTPSEYERFIEEQITKTLALQEEIGLDVLVHGEFERNDMVEYFGEQLDGFAFTEHGWVQTYGSRCVKPPIIFGDVSRPRPMTVRWIALRPVAHLAADEGHAHRAGHDPAMVVRARRPAAQRNGAARSRWRSATRCATSKRPASA